MSNSEQLRNVLLELAHRDPKLAGCWEQVLQDLNIELGDLVAGDDPDKERENEALRNLRQASHGVLADRLALWARVQRQMQPVIDRLEAQCDAFEKEADRRLDKCLKWQAWEHIDGNPLDLSSVQRFALEGKSLVEKASVLLAQDATSLATHLWCQQNEESDVALLMWKSGSTEYELRRRRVNIMVPFADDRDVLYVRMLRTLPDQCVAIMSCSLTAALAESLQLELKWFAVPPKVTRTQICDCYLVQELCPGISRVDRLTHFSEAGSEMPFLVQKASGVSFNTKDGILSLKEAVVNGNVASVAVPLAALGAGAAVGAVAGPVAVTGVVAAAGFSSTGIVAGSAAASMMSASAIAGGGGVASGSLVAVGQSIGAAGLAGGPLGLAIAGGVVVVGAATVGIFFGAKAIHKKVGDAKRTPGGAVHHCATCDDRKM